MSPWVTMDASSERPLHRLVGSMHRLVVFDAVVRAGSFTAAARTLGVSQPAVSRQISLLEDELQTTLFVRDRTRPRLTATGAALHEHVDSGFAEIETGLADVRGLADTLTLAVQPAIAESWFSPHLASLREAVAPTTVQLVIFDDADELSSIEHDVSVRFGSGFGSGLRSELLIAERVTPVAAPDFAAAHGLDDTSTATRLTEVGPLLDLDPAGRGWMDWSIWFELAGEAWTPPPREIRYRNYAVVVQQALSGGGVALGWETLLGGLLGRELLVPAGPTVARPDVGYHLVWPTGMTRHDGLRDLRDWVRRTVAWLTAEADAA